MAKTVVSTRGPQQYRHRLFSGNIDNHNFKNKLINPCVIPGRPLLNTTQLNKRESAICISLYICVWQFTFCSESRFGPGLRCNKTSSPELGIRPIDSVVHGEADLGHEGCLESNMLLVLISLKLEVQKTNTPDDPILVFLTTKQNRNSHIVFPMYPFAVRRYIHERVSK